MKEKLLGGEVWIDDRFYGVPVRVYENEAVILKHVRESGHEKECKIL